MVKTKCNGVLRYKDKGKIVYNIIPKKNVDLRDCLELIYSDDEKIYEWHYYWQSDHKLPIEHIEEVSYEGLKAGFLKHIDSHGYIMHKGEYQLLKESIVIFVSHKEYILQICEAKKLNNL